MFLIFDAISGILSGLLGLLVMLVLLPVVVQVVIHMIINMINNTLKTNIRPLLNLLFFPGAMVRASFIYLVLTLMGWQVRVFYGRLGGLQTPTSTNSHFSGFNITMRPPMGGVKVSQSIIISLSGYFVWAWVLLFLKYQYFIVNYMEFLWGANVAIIVFVLILLSLVIGGMPIPEETMLPLHHVVSHNPHLVVSAMIGFIGAALVGGLYGVMFGQLYFGVLMALLIVRHMLDAKELKKLLDARSHNWGEDIHIEEVMLF